MLECICEYIGGSCQWKSWAEVGSTKSDRSEGTQRIDNNDKKGSRELTGKNLGQGQETDSKGPWNGEELAIWQWWSYTESQRGFWCLLHFLTSWSSVLTDPPPLRGWTNNVHAPLQCQHIKQATIRKGSFSSKQLLAAIILLVKFHSGKYCTDINQVSQPFHPIAPKPLWPLKTHQTVARTHLPREDRSSGQLMEIYAVLAPFQPIFFSPGYRRGNRDLSDIFAWGSLASLLSWCTLATPYICGFEGLEGFPHLKIAAPLACSSAWHCTVISISPS